MTLGENPTENTVGKGDKTGNQHLHLFPNCTI